MCISLYLKSVFKKLDFYLSNKQITSLLYLQDQDHHRLADVVFLQTNNQQVIGMFIDGVNPFFTSYLPDQRDDFNLFATYEKLSIQSVPYIFCIEKVYSFHHRLYHEHLAIYVSNKQEKQSILILFLQDECYIKTDISYEQCKEIILQNIKHTSKDELCCYHRDIVSNDWIEITD
ncbi:unnamed protein product [Commensalibacter communis]|uniref:Uncharacterized protein n=1 Tax=Commensalibacter communis TaxID=2972786 RepID=A0A9W4XAB0_9PROT|nr:unnamed protein product [Commensalibacter communis]CAI3950840.1 unnamed protein product [Commensalibacter communis]CAI3952152.1 unnamed protein product [Commensalibacter communis]CAI3953300.1 unnamed protein product [Commensalibacter communis]CAI3954316.1 unnamed protein product [Commensalibacter communis]